MRSPTCFGLRDFYEPHRSRPDQRATRDDPRDDAAAALMSSSPHHPSPATMTCLPLYRLLMATGILMAGAVVASRFGHVEPRDPCQGRSHVYTCALFHGPQTTITVPPVKLEVPAAAREW